MDLFGRSVVSITRLGVLSGAFHPPTRAHLALARAALAVVERVLWVMPGRFPHKEYEGVALADRLEMVRRVTAGEERFLVGVSRGGLYLEIARECREAFGSEVQVRVVCGTDAAERALGWDYGAGPGMAEQLAEYRLLVAERAARLEVPEGFRGGIERLEMGEDWGAVSSSEVRRRVVAGESWRELVPASIEELVARLYGGSVVME
jgi:nicotinic acid mononucleotide adenylyltransferase